MRLADEEQPHAKPVDRVADTEILFELQLGEADVNAIHVVEDVAEDPEKGSAVSSSSRMRRRRLPPTRPLGLPSQTTCAPGGGGVLIQCVGGESHRHF